VIVGTLEIQLLIPDARSLKEKRRVLNSIKDRVRSRFNVSIAELEADSGWQRAVLGVALVANERRFAEEVLTEVIKLIQTNPAARLITYQIET